MATRVSVDAKGRAGSTARVCARPDTDQLLVSARSEVQSVFQRGARVAGMRGASVADISGQRSSFVRLSVAGSYQS
jgi:hypothetical protein